jgi:putative ABC transport system permease protein
VRQRPFPSDEEAEAIQRLPEIEYAQMYGVSNQRVTYRGEQTRAIAVYGSGRHGVEIDGGTIIAGRNFTPEEERQGGNVVVLYEQVVDRIFGREDPLGKVIRLGTQSYVVIGVYRKPDNLFASDGNDEAVAIPFKSLERNFLFDERQGTIVVKPRGSVSLLQAQDAVTREMRRLRSLKVGDTNNFDLINQAEVLNTWNKLTGVFFLVMLVLAGVSLMVGGIGVTAIMMVSVTERTREIGLRKALGARRVDILWQFLVEAATLTLLGGVAGLLLGTGVAAAMNSFSPIPAKVPLWSIGLAVGASVVVGIVFGMIPANRAARLDPIEALRHE